MASPTSETGSQAERQAEQHLNQHGLRTLEKNYRCKVGEIDLIMSNQNSLVFIEVRFRKNAHFGSAAESVDHKKQMRIRKSAEHYLLKNKKHNNLAKRFDVVAITGKDFQWLQGAF